MIGKYINRHIHDIKVYILCLRKVGEEKNIGASFSMNEQKIVGASYIISLYNESEGLLRQLGLYSQIKLELTNKYQGQIEKMPEEERTQIRQAVGAIRYYMTTTKTRVGSLRKNIKIFDEKYPDIEKLYNQCQNELVPAFADLEQYVNIVHGLFVDGVVSELLTTSQSIYQQYSSAGVETNVQPNDGQNYPQ